MLKKYKAIISFGVPLESIHVDIDVIDEATYDDVVDFVDSKTLKELSHSLGWSIKIEETKQDG